MSQPSNATWCDDCGARTDITNSCHPYTCKYVPKCNDCGVRTDINGYCHKFMCKYAML